ncbi:hypothetical protein ABBQ38_011458 [Trebouxia sp. C0009 RCD-2024]
MLQLDIHRPRAAAVAGREPHGHQKSLPHGRLASTHLQKQKPSRRCKLHSMPARAQAQAQAEAPLAPVEQKPSRMQKNITWDTLGFGLEHVASSMFVAEWTPEQHWKGQMMPYGPLHLDPAAQVLNYGQSVFEGMKAQRSAKDRIVLFRPDQNAARMAAGAARLSMPAPPSDLFVNAVQQLVRENQDYVPPQGKGSLYIRPLLLGSGGILGLGPAPSYTFAIYCAAVGAYFKGGQTTPIDLVVEEHFHRAAPGGMGGTKAAGNYSPVLTTQLAAKQNGYADVVYLDAKTDTYLEEVSSCNIFIVKDRHIKTPELSGTILPGITRRSILELAASKGYTVEEAPVTLEEALKADEVFTSGTAVVVSPVGSLTHQGRKVQYGEPGVGGPVATELYDALTGVQQEKIQDSFGWVVPVV